jgi:mono/diheme cytochrome c family protein
MRNWVRAGLFAGLLALPVSAGWAEDKVSLERGLYVTRLGGCNDCHTPGFAQSGGTLPQSAWLMGSPVGFQGPWGTTYAGNLRLILAAMTEDQWVVHAKAVETRPPMPWFNLHAMTEDDLRSMYQFIRSLGEPGAAGPDYLPPGVKPKTPFVVFEPQMAK